MKKIHFHSLLREAWSCLSWRHMFTFTRGTPLFLKIKEKHVSLFFSERHMPFVETHVYFLQRHVYASKKTKRHDLASRGGTYLLPRQTHLMPLKRK